MCCLLEQFLFELQQNLVAIKNLDNTIIRLHTRKFEELGDLSFPLSKKNWHRLLAEEPNKNFDNYEHIFPEESIEKGLESLSKKSCDFKIKIINWKVIKNDAHIFMERQNVFKKAITDVLTRLDDYGKSETLYKNINVTVDNSIKNAALEELDLTSLRVLILRDVTRNLCNFASTSAKLNESCGVVISFNSNLILESDFQLILCGPVINDRGVKDATISGQDLYNKRAGDMRMMAQHKYGVQIKPNSDWNEYFKNLGKNSVTIEILSNKPHKSIQILLNDLRTANKGSSFIFYNSARLAALFREFKKRVDQNIYPPLPDIERINFSLLKEAEEWELLYAYILQFPIVIKNCIKDIEQGKLNPQYLVTFLSNLSSVFSVYYRRVRILTDPREHLFPIIHSRIYLLKALECVFHNALRLMNIEPIKEM